MYMEDFLPQEELVRLSMINAGSTPLPASIMPAPRGRRTVVGFAPIRFSVEGSEILLPCQIVSAGSFDKESTGT